MTIWLALRRLLPLLAVLSLAFAPATAPAATARMHASPAAHVHHTAMPDMALDEMAMDEMPCCPREIPAEPDCAKGCPLMALCLAKVGSIAPLVPGLAPRVAVVQGKTWAGDASFASLALAPPSEPPRS